MKKVLLVFIPVCLLGCIKGNSVANAKASDKIIYQISDNGDTTYKYIDYYSNNKIRETGFLYGGVKTGVCKKFDENGKLLVVNHYFKGEAQFELDIKDFSFEKREVPLNDGKAKLSVLTPSAWSIVSENSKDILFACKKTNISDQFAPVVTINADKLNDKSINDYNDLTLKGLENQFDFFKPISKERIKVNGVDCYRISFAAVVDSTRLGCVLSVYNVNDESVIIISSMAGNDHGNFLKYKGLFEEIADSIHIQ